MCCQQFVNFHIQTRLSGKVMVKSFGSCLIRVHDTFGTYSQESMMIQALLIIGHRSRIVQHGAQFQMVCLQLASEWISRLVTNLSLLLLLALTGSPFQFHGRCPKLIWRSVTSAHPSLGKWTSPHSLSEIMTSWIYERITFPSQDLLRRSAIVHVLLRGVE